MTALLYKEGGLQTTVDLGMSILQGRAVGGTTYINNAICFRLDDDDGTRVNPNAPDVLADVGDARRARRPRPRCRRLRPRRVHARRRRDLRRRRRAQRQRVPRRLAARWSTPGRPTATWPARRFRKNYDDCAACGYCNFGCAYDRRHAPLETYLPEAVKAGATVAPGCHAERHRDRRRRRARRALQPQRRRGRGAGERRGAGGRRHRLERALAQERHPAQRRQPLLVQRRHAGARALPGACWTSSTATRWPPTSTPAATCSRARSSRRSAARSRCPAGSARTSTACARSGRSRARRPDRRRPTGRVKRLALCATCSGRSPGAWPTGTSRSCARG